MHRVLIANIIYLLVNMHEKFNELSWRQNTVEPLNKGHFGDNINSAVLSFIEKLSSPRRFSVYRNKVYIGNGRFWDLEQCPL